jgi:hypothetical protein
MGNISRPSKEKVRDWLADRRIAATPLPDARQIRQQLGWEYSRDAATAGQPRTTSGTT